ncbi:MAG TPA: ABC transporter permease [Methylomirabilota bacterium]|jgi:putative spermidine/putrescine transport system permease protein|nr:ABC transporter permease [Methylomirabilota bacterium]
MGIERVAAVTMWTVMAAVVLILLSPLIVTVAVSFSSSPVFNLPPPEWSLRWYQRTMTRESLWASVRLSVEIALLSTGVSLVLGTLCAIAVARGTFPGKTAVVTFMVSPLMMPGLVLGVAILQALREVGLRDAWAGLLIGHVVITLPYVTRTVLASLSLFDFTLIEAARTLGSSYPRSLLKVMVPVLAPAFLTSGLFAFLASMDNYPISIFLIDARNKTLPILMLQYLEENPDPTIAAVSSGLILLTIVVLLLADRLVGLRRLADF